MDKEEKRITLLNTIVEAIQEKKGEEIVYRGGCANGYTRIFDAGS